MELVEANKVEKDKYPTMKSVTKAALKKGEPTYEDLQRADKICSKVRAPEVENIDNDKKEESAKVGREHSLER